MTTEALISSVHWRPVADGLPDDEETVLVHTFDGEVLSGFHEADRWHYVTGYPMTVPPTHWARMPEGPR